MRRAEQTADDGMHYTDNEGPQPSALDYYIMDNGKSGVFITEIRLPLDAIEGHGARLHQSIDTFKIFENQTQALICLNIPIRHCLKIRP